MADRGCSVPWGTAEGQSGPGPVCSDRLDNDLDGYCDSSDEGCRASNGASECHSSLTQCDNCADDDGDGLVDMRDGGCLVPWDVSEASSLSSLRRGYGDQGRDNSDLVENMQAGAAELLGGMVGKGTAAAVKRAARLAGRASALAEAARPRVQGAEQCAALERTVRRYSAKMRQLKAAATAGSGRSGGGAKVLRRALDFSGKLLQENGCSE